MKAYEIEGWLDGVKIRQERWQNDQWMFYDGDRWINQDGKFGYDNLRFVYKSDGKEWYPEIECNLIYDDDWEIYEEPKPAYRDVVQYRAVFEETEDGETVSEDCWSTIKTLTDCRIGHEQRTIRIHDDGRVEVIG